MWTGTRSVMEGSLAIARAVQAARPAVIATFPITPQTHIIEALAKLAADGELDTEYIRADSEFSAASIVAGASAAGVRAYTASSSQGLLLMTEVFFYLAGQRLPVVFTGANRQVSVPIGLQPDHQDSLTFRDTGLIQLYVESAQEAYDAHIQAFKIAEDHRVLLPVMVCADGFTLTHVYEPVELFNQADIDTFLPRYDPLVHLTPEQPMVLGSHVDETNALEFRYLTYQASQGAKQVIEEVAKEWAELSGHYQGGLIDSYFTEDAEVILVAMGSAVSTLREAVDELRSQGQRVGLVKVRCFRPFPVEELRQGVCQAKAVVVLDRSLSMGFQGILATDVKAALYDASHRPLVIGKMAGYGGREVTLETARRMVEDAIRAVEAGCASSEPDFMDLKVENLELNQEASR